MGLEATATTRTPSGTELKAASAAGSLHDNGAGYATATPPGLKARKRFAVMRAASLMTRVQHTTAGSPTLRASSARRVSDCVRALRVRRRRRPVLCLTPGRLGGGSGHCRKPGPAATTRRAVLRRPFVARPVRCARALVVCWGAIGKQKATPPRPSPPALLMCITMAAAYDNLDPIPALSGTARRGLPIRAGASSASPQCRLLSTVAETRHVITVTAVVEMISEINRASL